MSASEQAAQRLVRGEATAAEARELVRAVLLAGDPGAAEEEALEPEVDAGSYVATLEALAARTGALEDDAAADRVRAEASLSVLLALPRGERPAAIGAEPGGGTWALVDLLCERSFAAGPEHPEHSRDLARLAAELAERIDEGPESEALRGDLRGLAWAQLGNAERIASDLNAAETALGRAAEHLERGTGDPLARARLLGFQATLLSDRSRFDEAVALARRAASLYRRLGDDHGYGRTLLKLATFHSYRDELDLALTRLGEALGHLDSGREPRLLFAARHNRASYLERAGRLDEASQELGVAGELAEASLDHLRLRWLAGRIAVRRGESAAGESELAAVRAAFLEHGLGYETAQVSLELAVLYAEQGRIADQKRLAEEIAPLFAARGVHPEARAALALFCDAARRESASAALARGVAEYLERAYGRPGVAFLRSGD